MNRDQHLIDRVSYVSSVTKQKDADEYKEAQTPLEEGGALRAGGALVYTSPEVLTLIFQYATVGIVYGGFSSMKYPVLQNYFGMESAPLSSASGLMSLGWSFKVFYGMLSDCFPIMGYSRKPYILIGWLATAICLCIICFYPVGDAVTVDTPALILKSAQSHGSTLALLCTIACFCYIMADVACDAMVVEYAQREPENIRGRLQATIYGTRYIFQGVASAIGGFAMNSERYGGSFSFDISVNAFFAILATPVVLNTIAVFFFMKDRKKEPVILSVYFSKFFDLVKKRAVWQVMIFNFMFALFSSGIFSNAGYFIKKEWAHVQPINSSIADILSYVLFAGTLGVVAKWGTMWNWRFVLVITTLTASGIDAIAQFLTIYDVVRSEWFYLGIPLTEQIPIGIQFVVSTFVIVELAGDGNEGLMYGLMTTCANLSGVFGTMITNVYSTKFRISRPEIKSDLPEIRNDCAYTYLIVYATTTIACMWTLILPNQKAAVKRMLETGGESAAIGSFILFAAFAILCLSITGTMLSMFESTSCYLLAGGSGCE